MRLIDADELFQPDENSDKVLIIGGQASAGKTVALAMKLLEKKVADAPTIEAEPVKHGRWHDCYQIDEFHYIRICSECANRNVFHKYDSVGNYCPNCGARMDGDSDA